MALFFIILTLGLMFAGIVSGPSPRRYEEDTFPESTPVVPSIPIQSPVNRKEKTVQEPSVAVNHSKTVTSKIANINVEEIKENTKETLSDININRNNNIVQNSIKELPILMVTDKEKDFTIDFDSFATFIYYLRMVFNKFDHIAIDDFRKSLKEIRFFDREEIMIWLHGKKNDGIVKVILKSEKTNSKLLITYNEEMKTLILENFQKEPDILNTILDCPKHMWGGFIIEIVNKEFRTSANINSRNSNGIRNKSEKENNSVKTSLDKEIESLVKNCTDDNLKKAIELSKLNNIRKDLRYYAEAKLWWRLAPDSEYGKYPTEYINSMMSYIDALKHGYEGEIFRDIFEIACNLGAGVESNIFSNRTKLIYIQLAFQTGIWAEIKKERLAGVIVRDKLQWFNVRGLENEAKLFQQYLIEVHNISVPVCTDQIDAWSYKDFLYFLYNLKNIDTEFARYDNNNFNAVLEFKLPFVGEGINELKIVNYYFEPGDQIKEADILFDGESHKVFVEIPSPIDGKILELKVSEGTVAVVGDVILTIAIEDHSSELIHKIESNLSTTN